MKSESDAFTWSVTNIHTLMSDLSITELERLVVYPGCQLKCDYTCTSQAITVNVKAILMLESIYATMLMTLLAYLQVDNLHFTSRCEVLGLLNDNPPQKQVSHRSLYSANSMINHYRNKLHFL